MIRLTRHETAFVKECSYRSLSERLKRMGFNRRHHGPLPEEVLALLGVNQKLVDKAFERAAKLTIQDVNGIRENCAQCTKLGSICNEHKGMIFFLPKQIKLPL